MLKDILIMLVYASVSSFGLYKIKSATSIFNFGFAIGLVLYGLGFVLWLYILKTHPLSIAFPVAASSLIIATQLIGLFLLHEPLGLSKICGLLFIIIGIALLY